MDKKIIIGIDVSKEKLDFCLLNGDNIAKEWVCTNATSDIRRALSSLKATPDNVLVCAEYTGQYTYPLACVCEALGIALWLENPTQIKYRSGMQRGKNDKLDARKIAAYAARFRDEARLFSLPEKHMASLRQLVSERDLYMSDKAKYHGQLTDQERFMAPHDYAEKKARLERLIDGLNACIDEVEAKIRELINSDGELSRLHQLLLSVDGVGEQTSVKMIIETNAFKDFTDPRKFCCHAGVAPFRYTSGSSQRSRNRVSSRADKSIKTLLHMAALVAATRIKRGELRDYYLRKVEEGKNKMSVLNAVRAKLVYRMFAVVKHNLLYQPNYALAIVK